MYLKYFLGVILMFIALEAIGQKYLVMDKIGGRQRREFYPGDELIFRLRGEDHFNTAVITHLQDSLVFFDQGVVNVNEIASIRTKPRQSGIMGASSTAKFRIAGVGLVLIDQFNNVVIAGGEFRLSRGVLIAGGSLVALSYIIDLTQKNKYKIKGNRRLRIVDVSFG